MSASNRHLLALSHTCSCDTHTSPRPHYPAALQRRGNCVELGHPTRGELARRTLTSCPHRARPHSGQFAHQHLDPLLLWPTLSQRRIQDRCHLQRRHRCCLGTFESNCLPAGTCRLRAPRPSTCKLDAAAAATPNLTSATCSLACRSAASQG